MIDIETVDKWFEAGRASGLLMQFRLFDKKVLIPVGQLPEAVACETGETIRNMWSGHRCGELDGGVDGERVWMTCDCGAGIAHPIEPAGLDQPREQR